MEKSIKLIISVLVVLFIAWMIVSVFASNAGATPKPPEHYQWVETGTEWSGECEAEVPACNQTAEGTEYGIMTETCQKVEGDSRSKSPSCKKDDTRTTEVSRACEVKGDMCEPEGSCSDACGLEATEVPDGQGGYKVCEATPACVEPTCEELNNCPVPPVTPVVEEKKSSSSDGDSCDEPGTIKGFRYMPVGNSTRLRWTEKSDIKLVDIKVYGADKSTVLGYVRTADDGEYIYPSLVNWYRIRAVDEQCGLSKWSKMVN